MGILPTAGELSCQYSLKNRGEYVPLLVFFFAGFAYRLFLLHNLIRRAYASLMYLFKRCMLLSATLRAPAT